MFRLTAAQRREQRFEALVKKKFGYNASLNPNNVNTQPDGGVVAPRPPTTIFFRGRIVYLAPVTQPAPVAPIF